jgi:hypothetical protein
MFTFSCMMGNTSVQGSLFDRFVRFGASSDSDTSDMHMTNAKCHGGPKDCATSTTSVTDSWRADQ